MPGQTFKTFFTTMVREFRGQSDESSRARKQDDDIGRRIFWQRHFADSSSEPNGTMAKLYTADGGVGAKEAEELDKFYRDNHQLVSQYQIARDRFETQKDRLARREHALFDEVAATTDYPRLLKEKEAAEATLQSAKAKAPRKSHDKLEQAVQEKAAALAAYKIKVDAQIPAHRLISEPATKYMQHELEKAENIFRAKEQALGNYINIKDKGAEIDYFYKRMQREKRDPTLPPIYYSSSDAGGSNYSKELAVNPTVPPPTWKNIYGKRAWNPIGWIDAGIGGGFDALAKGSLYVMHGAASFLKDSFTDEKSSFSRKAVGIITSPITGAVVVASAVSAGAFKFGKFCTFCLSKCADAAIRGVQAVKKLYPAATAKPARVLPDIPEHRESVNETQILHELGVKKSATISYAPRERRDMKDYELLEKKLHEVVTEKTPLLSSAGKANTVTWPRMKTAQRAAVKDEHSDDGEGEGEKKSEQSRFRGRSSSGGG